MIEGLAGPLLLKAPNLLVDTCSWLWHWSEALTCDTCDGGDGEASLSSVDSSEADGVPLEI